MSAQGWRGERHGGHRPSATVEAIPRLVRASSPMTYVNVSEPLRSLLSCGKRLPGDVREQILAAGDAAVGPLLAIVKNADLHREDSPGEGYAPIHAVKLLGELGATEAIEPLLDLLDDSRPEEIIYSTLIHALARLGAAALEPTLAHLEKARSEQTKHSFREVLSRAGVRDDRVLAALLEGLAHDVILGAGDLADYGDPAALPALLAAAERSEPGGEGLFDGQELIDLEDAIVTLGGEIPPSMEKKLEVVRASRRRSAGTMGAALGRAQSLASRKERIGRNDPCPCGSGKKYKKCCLGRP